MAQFKKDKFGSSLVLPGNGHQGSSIQDILTSVGVLLRPTKARSVQFWSLSEYIRKLKGPPLVRGTFSSVINSEDHEWVGPPQNEYGPTHPKSDFQSIALTRWRVYLGSTAMLA